MLLPICFPVTICYGNSIALTFLVRRYFLPLVRVLMMNPLKSECAVGINSHGPEWDQMMKYLRSKNESKFLAGDYSKFDQKLPAQVLFAGLRILIDCASKCPGYSNDDLRAMKAMAGDLVYSVIAFDGNLIGLTSGGHISEILYCVKFRCNGAPQLVQWLLIS